MVANPAIEGKLMSMRAFIQGVLVITSLLLET